jgi:hypothetical protein
MKIKKNGKVITLNESDLKRIVKRTLNEQWTGGTDTMDKTLTVDKGLPNCEDILKRKAEKNKEENEQNSKSDHPLVYFGEGRLDDISLIYVYNMDTLVSNNVLIGNMIAIKDGKHFCVFPKIKSKR